MPTVQSFDSYYPFGIGIVSVAPSPATTGTSLTVASNPGLPEPGSIFAPCQAVVCPAGATPTVANAEIIRITQTSLTELTIVRAQEGTTAQPIAVGWQVFVAFTQKGLLDLQNAVPPIGSILPWAGYGDPGGYGPGYATAGVWLIADGRLIDSTVYPTFDSLCGASAASPMTHAYNLGVNPGNNSSGHQQAKIPDKRGRSSMGAINMGSGGGAGTNDNAHAQLTPGASGGEVLHTLLTAESPSHSHTSTAVNGSGSTAGLDYVAAAVVGNFGTSSVGGGGGHNTLSPYQADSYIVRVA